MYCQSMIFRNKNNDPKKKKNNDPIHISSEHLSRKDKGNQ